MANIIAGTSGNFTASTTWKAVDTASELDSETGTNAVGTATVYSSSWTTDSNIVDGVAVKLAARVASPTGTFKVILRNVTGAIDVDSVTVNSTDLPVSGLGWQTFKFGTSHTLITSNNYAVGVACSVANEVTLYRDASASNSCRKVRTVVATAPGASSHFVISNELTGPGTKNVITVTMDNTATTIFGTTVSGGPPEGMVVSGGGTLTLGTAASTAYNLNYRGIFQITGNGVVNIATQATPLPASSSFLWQANPVVAGDSGIQVQNGGTLNMYGASKTAWTNLSHDVALGTATFTTSNNTGWGVNDTIVFAATDQTNGHFDALVILATGAAGTSTTSTTCTAAHSGTTPTQAEVINVTRNVKVTSTATATTITSYMFFDTTSLSTMSNVEFSNLGTNNSTKAGLECAVTSGTLVVQGCGFHDCTGNSQSAFRIDNSNDNNFVLNSNGMYNIDAGAAASVYINATLTNTNWSVTNNVVMRANNGRAFQFGSLLGTITGNVATSGNGDGFFWNSSATNTAVTTGNLVLNVTSNTSHSNASTGFNDNGSNYFGITFGQMVAYRNSQAGIKFTGVNEDLILMSATTFGNNTQNLTFQGGNTRGLTFNNLTAGGDTSFATTELFNGGGNNGINVTFNTCTIDVVTGIFTQHTNIFANGGSWLKVFFNNCQINPSGGIPAGIVGGGSYVGTPNSYGYRVSSVSFNNFNGTTTDHRYYTPIYTIQSDNVIFGSAAPSERLIPFSTQFKSWSSPRQITVSSGGTHVVQVALRLSTSADAGGVTYSGNNPRLMQRGNSSIGLTTETALATFTLAAGTWGTLTGTTGAATENGVQEFYIDADGTSSAWINIDDWNIT